MKKLIDNYGRVHDYLRISLLERCNLRCTYCMPEEGIVLREKSVFMTQEELIEIATIFVNYGIKKIRLTGGEPLLKKNFAAIIHELAKLPVELTLTTNAILLDKYIIDLQNAGVRKLNISLDSLQEDRFNAISRRTDFKRIRSNIDLALQENFKIKLNVVLMKGVNEDEIIDFIELSRSQPLNIRFIEFMPFNGNQWDSSKTVTYAEIMALVKAHFGEKNILTEELPPNSTSKNFRIKGYSGDFGIISSITNPFCDTCNRIRLTADGKIKNCLFSADEQDLLGALRSGENITGKIENLIANKKAKHAGITSFESSKGQLMVDQNRSMTTIGG